VRFDYVLLKPVDAQAMNLGGALPARGACFDLLAAGRDIVALCAEPSAGEAPVGDRTSRSASVLFGTGVVLATYALWMVCAAASFWVRPARQPHVPARLDLRRPRAGRSRCSTACGRVVFTFVIPVAVMTTYPAMALLGRPRDRQDPRQRRRPRWPCLALSRGDLAHRRSAATPAHPVDLARLPGGRDFRERIVPPPRHMDIRGCNARCPGGRRKDRGPGARGGAGRGDERRAVTGAGDERRGGPARAEACGGWGGRTRGRARVPRRGRREGPQGGRETRAGGGFGGSRRPLEGNGLRRAEGRGRRKSGRRPTKVTAS